MTPRPDVSWQAVALDARVQGPHQTNLNGRLQLDQVSGGGGGVQRLVADVAGDQGLMRSTRRPKGCASRRSTGPVRGSAAHSGCHR